MPWPKQEKINKKLFALPKSFLKVRKGLLRKPKNLLKINKDIISLPKSFNRKFWIP